VGIKSSLKPEHLLAALFRQATADKRIRIYGNLWKPGAKPVFTGMCRIKAAKQIYFFDFNSLIFMPPPPERRSCGGRADFIRSYLRPNSFCFLNICLVL